MWDAFWSGLQPQHKTEVYWYCFTVSMTRIIGESYQIRENFSGGDGVRIHLYAHLQQQVLIKHLIYVGTQTRKLPIPVRGSALPVLVPILKITSVHFLIRIFPKYDKIHQYR